MSEFVMPSLGADMEFGTILKWLVKPGDAVYFRHGCSKQTFNYLNHYTWKRVWGWLRRKHRRANWKAIRRRYLMLQGKGLVPHDAGIELLNVASVPVTRYRYRGTKIPNPWTERPTTTTTRR